MGAFGLSRSFFTNGALRLNPTIELKADRIQNWYTFCSSFGYKVLPLHTEKSNYEHRKRIRKICCKTYGYKQQ